MSKFTPQRIAAVLINAALIAFAALAFAAPASAQEWTTAFKPGELELPPEGYAQAREAAAWMDGAPRFRSSLAIIPYESVEESGSGAGQTRARAMQLELARLGISIAYSRIQPTVISNDTVARRVVVSGRLSDRLQPPSGYIDQMLVYFGSGSTEIPEDFRRLLLLYVAGYRPGEGRVLIYGHADTAGAEEANLRLSRDRAEAVGRFLAGNGVRWEDICMTGKGETQLARATQDGVSEPLNRRAIVDLRDSSARC